jgi:hypothetical protein
MAIDVPASSSTSSPQDASASSSRRTRTRRRHTAEVPVPAWLGSGDAADPAAEPIFAELARGLDAEA